MQEVFKLLKLSYHLPSSVLWASLLWRGNINGKRKNWQSAGCCSLTGRWRWGWLRSRSMGTGEKPTRQSASAMKYVPSRGRQEAVKHLLARWQCQWHKKHRESKWIKSQRSCEGEGISYGLLAFWCYKAFKDESSGWPCLSFKGREIGTQRHNDSPVTTRLINDSTNIRSHVHATLPLMTAWTQILPPKELKKRKGTFPASKTSYHYITIKMRRGKKKGTQGRNKRMGGL